MVDLVTRAKEKYPNESEEVIVQAIQGIRNEKPDATDDEVLAIGEELIKQQGGQTPTVEVQSDTTVDAEKPDPRSYLMNKYGLDDKYSDQSRQKIVDENEKSRQGIDWTAFAGGIGQTIAGGDAAAATRGIVDLKEGRRAGKLADFDTQKKAAMENLKLDRELSKEERENEQFDPASMHSVLSREALAKYAPNLVEKMGDNFDKMTAQQISATFPIIQQDVQNEYNRLQDAEKARRESLKGNEEDDLKRKKAELEIKEMEDEARERKETRETETTKAKNTVKKLDELLTLSEDDLDSVYGKLERFYPDIARKQETIDTEIKIDNIVSGLTVDELSNMKGNPSDKDMEVVSSAATILSNKNSSPAAARKALKDAREVFRQVAARAESGDTGSGSSNTEKTDKQKRLDELRAKQ